MRRLSLKEFVNLFTPYRIPLMILILFAVILRILTAQMVLVGGADILDTWFSAKRILYGAPYVFSHRTTRFGAIIPVYITQLFFGTHPLVYYIAPALASIIQVIFLYKIGVKLAGKGFAFISTLLFMGFPEILVTCSNPRVSTFSVTYLLIGLYFLLKYWEAPLDCSKDDKRRENRYIILMSLLFFILYLTKVTNLYFLPGFIFIIWLKRKKIKPVLTFSLVLLGFYFIETFLYFIFTDFKLGRLSLILTYHFGHYTVIQLGSIWNLFDRYKTHHMEFYWLFSIILLLFSGIFLLIKDKDKRMKLLVLMSFIFLFLMTFMVKSFNPVIPANTFRTRYFSVLVPFIIIMAAKSIFIFISYLKVKYEFFNKIKDKKRLSVNIKYLFFGGIAILLTILGYTNVYMNQFYKKKNLGYFQVHPYKLVPEYYDLINRAYKNGIPIVVRGKSYFNRNYAYKVYRVQELMRKGDTLKESLKKLNIPLKTYLTCLYNVTKIRFYADEVFRRFFWDEEREFENDNFNPPETQTLIIKNIPIGYIIKEEYDNEIVRKKLTTDLNQVVVELKYKPFTAFKTNLKNVLGE